MSSGWTAVPNDVLIDTSLSINARMLYSILRMWARPLDGQFKVWPGCETLARNMGTSVSTVKRALKELDDRGLITRKRRIGTSSLTYIHEYCGVRIPEYRGVTHELTEQVTSEPTISSPVSQKEDPVEEDPDKDHAQKNVREVTRTIDECELPPEMSPKGNSLRSKKKTKVNHTSLARGVYSLLAVMWDREARRLGYEERDAEEESGILPQVMKAWKATGRRESPLNDPDAILAGLRKRAAEGGFWLDKFKFRWLFLSKAGSWYCMQLAHEGKLARGSSIEPTRPSKETMSRPGTI